MLFRSAPFSNEWWQGSTLLATHIVTNPVDFFTFTVPNVATTLQYQVRTRNLAAPAGSTSAVAAITVLADSDGDGLPDAWEAAYGVTDRNADDDGDGLKNWQEYLAGTNPTNALSYLKVEISRTSGSATLHFSTLSNLTYTLQYGSIQAGGAWTKLADFLARGSNRVETVTDTNWASERFYRIVTPRQP